MYLKREAIKRCFSKKDYENGMNYFKRGQVEIVNVEESEDETIVECLVSGTEMYETRFFLTHGSLGTYCSCPRFKTMRSCKHIAAALLAYTAEKENEEGGGRSGAASVKSDPNARQLLEVYMGKGQSGAPQTGKARLIPRISPYDVRGEYPIFSFQVGYERLYVIKDIREFLGHVEKGETVAYGKNLTLNHSLEQFDSLSRSLIDLLMEQFNEYRNITYRMPYYYDSWNNRFDKNEIQFIGGSFDRLFDLLKDSSIDTTEKGRYINFLEKDPEIKISLARNGNGVQLAVEKSRVEFFGSHKKLYAYVGESLLRCSESFRKQVWPLLNLGANRMKLALSDMPAFCSCVLPEIQEQVILEDPGELLQEFLPDECNPKFYFDIQNEILTLRVVFGYGKEEIAWKTPASKTPRIKRDIRTEQDTVQFVERYFQEENNVYFLSGDDVIFDFLSDEIEKFQKRGEVYTTDKLKQRRIQPAGTSIGVSVSDGILNLDIDTGEFPLEELESLYQSLLKKRRYHRLKDGRYLALDGSPLETVAEMTHMLQIPAKDLAKGTVNMPAYRGLYVEALLSEGAGDQQSLKVRRNQQFRAMVRNFKTVAESDYALPEGMEDILRPYQKIGFQWLKTLEASGFGGILADEMGLGKTAQIIAFLTTVSRKKAGRSSLVVCPASLILNWVDELEKFAPELRALPVMGTAAERKRLLASAGEEDILITSYELLRQDIEQYAKMAFYCCILDEAQHIKNQSTLGSKAVKKIQCQQRFVMTGTPIENRLSELWNLFDFLMPGYLYTHSSFVEKLEKPVIKSKDPKAMAQLQRLVQPFMLRRLKKDVLKELPPKIEYVRRISLSEEERKTYLAAVFEAKRTLEVGDKGKMQIFAALTQLRQICCDPGLCFENYHGPASKLEACLELCAGMVENGHQILLFSQFTTMLDIIRQRLDEQGISSYTLQGSTPKKERAALVKSFNAGGAQVFLISLKAGGTGLNLTAADVVIHYDPWWNQAAQDQATDRAHRIGQQARVQVYKLIAQDSIEEKILDLQEKKASLMDAVANTSGESLMSLSKEDLLMLLE